MDARVERCERLTGATAVPHKTRQAGRYTTEKKRDAPQLCQDASQESQFYFLTIIFLTRTLPSTSSRNR